MTIKRKLFIMSFLPTVTILLFSLNHLLDKSNLLKTKQELIVATKLIDNTSHLLHELQIERGLSSSFINKKNNHFKELLKEQKINTDKELKNFTNSFKLNKLTTSNQLLLDNINGVIATLKMTRNNILENKLTSRLSFKYYTNLNTQLIELTQYVKLYSVDKETYNKIVILKKFLQLSEYAGQERANNISIKKKYLDDELLLNSYYLLKVQMNLLRDIKSLTKNTNLEKDIINIEEKYKKSYLTKIREELNTKELKEDIDTKLWIDTCTDRINDYFKLEHKILLIVLKNINQDSNEVRISLYVQILLTIFITFLFLFGSSVVANNIVISIKQLNNGIDNFFDFLNFKSRISNKILVNSNDEVFEMAEKINTQISTIKINLEYDKDFIYELTEITKLMKDGNFTEKPYMEPSNPNLIKLKIVFNELLQFISDKIKEQTTELKLQKITLEDEVYYQTIEMEQQLIDITKSRDEVLAAQKSKDDFLANMSHEIRTPLNAILGFVTILQKRTIDTKSTKYLNIIDTSGKSLLAIINDILDFSKIQSGKFTITPRDIDPILEFSNITSLFASKTYEKHINYAVYIDPNISKTISVDDTRVKQILSNLLSNAIKFTPVDGMVKVKIQVEETNLIISVQDSGIGIAEKNISKVFSAFEQADGTTTRKYGGTGLGLSISSKLASLMNGTLELKSKEGVGSIFTLNVPINIVDSSSKQLIDINKISKYKFAILNTSKDDEIFSIIIKKYLQDLGITNVIELQEYKDYGYDILFFIPNDLYNEDIVENEISAIAMLRSNQVKLAHIDHITSLYAPFTPLLVIQAIDDITEEDIQQIELNKESISIVDEDEVTFKGKILVAEDNKTNQMLIGLLLFDYEIEYKIANNGLEAVTMFKEEKFDLVLMDENMPELNGLGAMKQIKAYEKETNLKTTPIIALTAAVLQTDVERFMSEGMDGFVAKPIDNKKLELELDKYLIRT